jgi:hypothetical protein
MSRRCVVLLPRYRVRQFAKHLSLSPSFLFLLLFFPWSLIFTARKTFRTVRRPYEKERLDQELKLCGEYGLRCKREIWRVQFMLSKVRKVSFSFKLLVYACAHFVVGCWLAAAYTAIYIYFPGGLLVHCFSPI